jgi:hypothetical protein
MDEFKVSPQNHLEAQEREFPSIARTEAACTLLTGLLTLQARRRMQVCPAGARLSGDGARTPWSVQAWEHTEMAVVLPDRFVICRTVPSCRNTAAHTRHLFLLRTSSFLK